MAQRLESASDLGLHGPYIGLSEGRRPELSPSDLPRAYSLPERYGIPLLELLVVDPEFIFLSWEIADSQLEQARRHFGEDGFFRRRLQVELLDATSTDAQPLARRELYGEVGRWFIQLSHPDIWLRARLQYVVGDDRLELGCAGPAFVPRLAPVTALEYQELRVIYGRGPTGELVLEGFEQTATDWPSVTLGPSASARDTVGQSATSASLFSLSARHRVDPTLLRPLLPVAPASIPEEDQE